MNNEELNEELNADLKAAIDHHMRQLRDIAQIAAQAVRRAERSEESDDELIFYNNWLTEAIELIGIVLAREPRRTYGGGLDQPSP